MASHILRGRSRVQIRMKFNREEKVNPEKVKEHLLRKKKPIGKLYIERFQYVCVCHELMTFLF